MRSVGGATVASSRSSPPGTPATGSTSSSPTFAARARRRGTPRALARSRIERSALAEQLDVVRDPLRARLRPADVVQPVEERVPGRAGESLEETLRGRVAIERALEVFRNLGLALGGIGGVPAPVRPGGLHLSESGRVHPSFRDQSLSLLAVYL